MPPPRALKRSSWEKRAAGLFFNAAAEHVCTIFFVWQYLWGRGKHDPSRHLSPDRRTRMGRDKISTMLPNTLKVRRNRTDKSSWKFCRVGSFVDKNDVKFWLVSNFVVIKIAAAKLSLEIQKYRLQSGRIYEIMENFRRIHTIACRRQEEKLGGWEILGRCCLRRMGCGRIFGHMRFEALGSRSSWLWMRTHRRCVFIRPAAGGGYIIFFVLLKQKIRHFSSCSKSSKFDKNSL